MTSARPPRPRSSGAALDQAMRLLGSAARGPGRRHPRTHHHRLGELAQQSLIGLRRGKILIHDPARLTAYADGARPRSPA